MNEPFDTIAKLALGACIGALVTNWIRFGREAASKRERFSSFLDLLRQKTETRIGAYFMLEHATTFSEFDTEALEVRQHVRHKARFDAACRAYKTISFDALDEKKNEDGRQKILAILGELLSYAK